jgi:hypothetical protein
MSRDVCNWQALLLHRVVPCKGLFITQAALLEQLNETVFRSCEFRLVYRPSVAIEPVSSGSKELHICVGS